MRLVHAMTNTKMHALLQQLGAILQCGSVSLSDGRVLHVCAQNGLDMGTLPVCAQLTHQYLKLGNGDIAMTNDPFVGGAHLGEVTLVTALPVPAEPARRTDRAATPLDLLIAVRFALQPNFSVSANQLREEVVPIPPMPIAHRGEVQTPLLEAIASHPLCPSDFMEQCHAALARLNQARALFQSKNSPFAMLLGREAIRDYLAASHHSFLHSCEEVAAGEVSTQIELATGEKLKIHLELTGEKIVFDFAGTEPSTRFHLTSTATFGLCCEAALNALPQHTVQDVPVNSGLFDLLEVKTPIECCLNARAPASTFLGSVVLAPYVVRVLENAIYQVIAKKKVELPTSSPSLINLSFGGRNHFCDAVFSGTSAKADSPGNLGLRVPAHFLLPSQRSIEELEATHPIVIRTLSDRTHSGGNGVQRGGDGAIKTYECLQDTTLHWWNEQLAPEPEGAEGAQEGTKSKIAVSHPGRDELESKGSITLHPGDTLTVMSSGGGGFGRIIKIPT